MCRLGSQTEFDPMSRNKKPSEDRTFIGSLLPKQFSAKCIICNVMVYVSEHVFMVGIVHFRLPCWLWGARVNV